MIRNKGLGLKSFLASGDFCHLLITFANSLEPDQGRHNVGLGLALNPHGNFMSEPV